MNQRGFTGHPAGDAIADLLSPVTRPILAPQAKKTGGKAGLLDDTSPAELPSLSDAGLYAMSDIALNAAGAVQDWASTKPEDLDDGETCGQRLLALLVGAADDEQDGDLDDDEIAITGEAVNSAADYLASVGVADDDIAALLNDWDEGAASRVQEFLADKLPASDEDRADDLESFVFGEGDATLDSTYKGRMSARSARPVKLDKKITGTVKLSAKQKMQHRRMQKRVRSAKAHHARMKSD